MRSYQRASQAIIMCKRLNLAPWTGTLKLLTGFVTPIASHTLMKKQYHRSQTHSRTHKCVYECVSHGAGYYCGAQSNFLFVTGWPHAVEMTTH